MGGVQVFRTFGSHVSGWRNSKVWGHTLIDILMSSCVCALINQQCVYMLMDWCVDWQMNVGWRFMKLTEIFINLRAQKWRSMLGRVHKNLSRQCRNFTETAARSNRRCPDFSTLRQCACQVSEHNMWRAIHYEWRKEGNWSAVSQVHDRHAIYSAVVFWCVLVS